jgi:hypothetical protein
VRVVAVDAEHVLEVVAAEDEDAIEAVGAERTYPAFGVGVRVRCLDRCADHLDALAAEDLVEDVTELCVPVVDEEPERLLVAELHHEVARLLRDSAPVRVGATGEVLDPPRRERDEDPLEERGLDGKQVTGEHARRLLA